MQSYEINQGKRKKAIKQVVKTNVKTAKGFPHRLQGETRIPATLAV